LIDPPTHPYSLIIDSDFLIHQHGKYTHRFATAAPSTTASTHLPSTKHGVAMVLLVAPTTRIEQQQVGVGVLGPLLPQHSSKTGGAGGILQQLILAQEWQVYSFASILTPRVKDPDRCAYTCICRYPCIW
jgi:hypothetical protein